MQIAVFILGRKNRFYEGIGLKGLAVVMPPYSLVIEVVNCILVWQKQCPRPWSATSDHCRRRRAPSVARVHPFLDGNGRVARLFSYALLRELNVGSSLWSVARGLARQQKAYKDALQVADEPRRGDLDGRGNLTLSGLEEFSSFFLTTCVDQVAFMDSLFEPQELLNRMEIWAGEETRIRRLPKGSWPLLREAVLAGEFPRGRAGDLTGYEERQARTVLSKLLSLGLLVADGDRGPVRLGFPIGVVERWFPRLYPGM